MGNSEQQIEERLARGTGPLDLPLMGNVDHESFALLRLLQLCNSSLPVGAYSYSEGLETLCQNNTLTCAVGLSEWLRAELSHGSIRVELAIMIRCYRAYLSQDYLTLMGWNDWFTASRETEELRLQSGQMGRSLLMLFVSLADRDPLLPSELLDGGCNFPTAFGITAAAWGISEVQAGLGYLQGWSANWVGAGVKLIPLGQTQGQQLLFGLGDAIVDATQLVLQWQDDELEGCSWGLQLASMGHETLYSRLFRS